MLCSLLLLLLLLLQVNLPYPAMMHDMAITPKYKVLLHMPLVFAPEVSERGLASQLMIWLWCANLD